MSFILLYENNFLVFTLKHGFHGKSD